MFIRLNPWLIPAAAFCALVWFSVGVTGVKLAQVYEMRGPMGFRHALIARLDWRADQLRSIVTGVDRMS